MKSPRSVKYEKQRDEEQLFSTHNMPMEKSYKNVSLHLRLILVKRCQEEAIEVYVARRLSNSFFRRIMWSSAHEGKCGVNDLPGHRVAQPLAHHSQVRLPGF